MSEDIEELLVLLRPYLKFMAASEQLGIDDDLISVGLDSMGTVDLLLEVEERFNMTIPDEFLVDETFATPSALWSVISSQKASEQQ